MKEKKRMLILASVSSRRLELLHQAGLIPDRVLPVELDETPRRQERPCSLALRLGSEKATAARALLEKDELEEAFVLAADTVVALGRRVLPKPKSIEEASNVLHILSGRKHTVNTGICLIAPSGKKRQKVVETKVFFKRLSFHEIQSYIKSGEWYGKAGGYAIQGLAGCFVRKLLGSYPNVVGLPLYETMLLLAGEGSPVLRKST